MGSVRSPSPTRLPTPLRLPALLRRGGRGASALLGGAPAPLLTLLAILFIHLGAALATTLFGALGVVGTAAMRLGFTALVLAAVWRPRPRALGRGGLAAVARLGVALAGLNVLFYLAIDRMPLGVVVMIEFIGPLGVAVAASRRAREFLWVALAAGGIVLLAPLREASVDPLGFAYALGAGACWAAYIVIGGRVGRRLPGGQGLALAMGVAALLTLPFGVADAGAALLAPRWLLLGLAVALISTVIPFTLEFEAMRRMSPRAFGVLLSSEPAIAALIGALLLGDRLDQQQLLALLLISVAAIASTAGRGER